MKIISNIFSFLLIWLLCSADGCDDGATVAEMREEKQISEMKDSVRVLFETETPVNLLQAYEETAKQKLIDFADYLKIISDSSVNKVFRVQAAEMASRLFISGNTDMTYWNQNSAVKERITLDSLLAKSLSARISSYIKPVQISIEKSLEMKYDTVFEGSLSFHPQQYFYIKKDSSETRNEMLIIDIYAIRKLKPFGKEFLSVWEVCLGDIKIATKQ